MLLGATAAASSVSSLSLAEQQHHHHHQALPSSVSSSTSDLEGSCCDLDSFDSAVNTDGGESACCEVRAVNTTFSVDCHRQQQQQQHEAAAAAAKSIMTTTPSSLMSSDNDDDGDDDDDTSSASSSKIDVASPVSSPTSCKEIISSHSCYSIFPPETSHYHSKSDNKLTPPDEVDRYTTLTTATSPSSSPPVLPSCSSPPSSPPSSPLQPQLQRPRIPLKSVLRSGRRSSGNGGVPQLTTRTPALKKSDSAGPRQHYYSYKTTTQRRVRGLWGGESSSSKVNGSSPSSSREDLFAQLYNEQLQQILSFLSMSDIICMSKVSKRWKHVALQKDGGGDSSSSCWNHVDATEFVHQTYRYFATRSNSSNPDDDDDDDSAATVKAAAAAKATSLALGDALQDRCPTRLTIQSIQHHLDPDIFLPSRIHRLQHLTMTDFANLTDTHVHVLFLSSVSTTTSSSSSAMMTCHKKVISSACPQLPLSRLNVDDCPRLTNACLLSIALHCPNLEHLSVCGNQRIDSLVALKDCWKVVMNTKNERPAAAPSSLSSSSSSAPPSSSNMTTTTPAVNTDCADDPLFMPLPPKLSASAALPMSLQTLFAQPQPPPLKLTPKLSVQTSYAPSSTTANDLAYLFAPPTGTSPKRPPPAPMTLHGRQRASSFSSSAATSAAAAGGGRGGKLTSIDFSFTKIAATPCLLLESLRVAVVTTNAASDGVQRTQCGPMSMMTRTSASCMPSIPVLDGSDNGRNAGASNNVALLGGLFAPPPALGSLFAPPPPRPLSAPSSALGGFFAPPPSSALGSMFASLPSGQSGNSNNSNNNIKISGISNSSTTTASIDPPRRRVALESLKMRGCGEFWCDEDLVQLGEMLAPCHLKVFDLACENMSGSCSQIMGHGLEALLVAEGHDDNNSNNNNKKDGYKLERLDLAGHDKLSARSLARIVSQSADTLTHLNVERCKRLFGSNGNKEKKITPLDIRSAAMTFASALAKATRLESLSLAHCVPFVKPASGEDKPDDKDKSKLRQCSNDDDDDIVMSTGKLYLDTFANSPLRLTLRELDLRGWWFVTSLDVAMIRNSCPRLQKLLCDN
jgi:F-box domain